MTFTSLLTESAYYAVIYKGNIPFATIAKYVYSSIFVINII